MDKIAINLLPPELVNVKRASAHKSLLFKASVGVLIVVIGVTGTLLFVNLIQNQVLSQANQQSQEAHQQLDSLSSQQAVIFSLKQRLGTINTLISTTSATEQTLGLISSLLPADVQVDSINIDNKDAVTLSVKANSSESFNTLVNNLTDPNLNQGQITSATLNSLSEKGDLIYQAEIGVVMKNAGKK